MKTKQHWHLVPFLLILAVLTSGCAGADADSLPSMVLDGAGIVADLLSTDTDADTGAGDSDGGQETDTVEASTEEAVTPYQQKLTQTLEARAAAGLPNPSSVTFEYELTPPREVAKADGNGTEQVVEITAKTVLHFDGPEEAGYDVWPALVVTGTLPTDAHGSVLAGDYTELYRTLLAEQIPGIWDQVEFGQEPRTQTISETFNVSYEGEDAGEDAAQTIFYDATGAVAMEPILLGLTYMGPDIDYTFGDSLSVRNFTVYDFMAGFSLDWIAGLRLPADVALNGVATDAGGSVRFSSVLFPQDWSEQAYIDAGVAPEGGDEFVLRFDTFLGIKAILLETNVCPGCYLETTVNESASFATPFGAGTSLPIPQIYVPIRNWSLGFASTDLGINIRPQLGSSQITADWHYRSSSECSDNGQITYTGQEIPVIFGPETDCAAGESGGPEEAEMQLTNFRYWFDQISVVFSISHETNLFGNDVLSGDRLPIQFNLSPLAGLFWLGPHKECTWDFNCQATDGYDSVLLSTMTEQEK